MKKFSIENNFRNKTRDSTESNVNELRGHCIVLVNVMSAECEHQGKIKPR